MDPLSVAASVVGLLSAAGQMLPILHNLSSTIKDAPHQIQAAETELSDISLTLTQLQQYLDGKTRASVQRLSLITLEHIATTLTGCVLTYSELDALLKSLRVQTRLRPWDRAIWVVKKDDVGLLIGRLQNHKSTLGLMLNIIQCASLDDAEKSMADLCATVNKILQSNQDLSMRLLRMENLYAPKAQSVRSTIRGSVCPSIIDVKPEANELHPVRSTSMSQLDSRHSSAEAYEEQLYRSHVYRHAANRHSASSMDNEGLSTLALSICSSLTLGEISNISVYALPVFASELSNSDCYDTTSSFARTPRLDPQLNSTTDGTVPGGRRARGSNGRMHNNPTTTNTGEILDAKTLISVSLETSTRYAHVAVAEIGYENAGYEVKGHIPMVVARCRTYLNQQHGTLGSVSISMPPDLQRTLRLKTILDEAYHHGRVFDWCHYNALDAVAVLKLYLEQLGEPIIPRKLYRIFHEELPDRDAFYGDALRLLRAENPTMEMEIRILNEPTLQVALLKYVHLFMELPPLNRRVMFYLMDLFISLAKQWEAKVTIEELAEYFQPGLLSDPTEENDESELTHSRDGLVFLILFGRNIMQRYRDREHYQAMDTIAPGYREWYRDRFPEA